MRAGLISAARRRSGGVILPYSPPNYANVELLLVGEGTDTGTLIRDRSGNLRAITVNGNGQVDTGVNLQGTSLLFDGTGDYLTTPDAADLRIGTSTDFCVEAYIRGASAKLNTVICKGNANSGAFPEFVLHAYNDGTLQLVTYSSGPVAAGVVSSSPGAISLATDYHVAASREGATLRLFINGVLVATGTQSGTINSNTALLFVGRNGSNTTNDFDGSLNFIRFTRGQALYTASFVPPVAADFFSYVEGTGPQVGWNAYDKHANIALSNGWRTATKTTSDGTTAMRATRGINAATESGYFEVRIDEGDQVGSFMMVGVGRSTVALTSFAGSGTDGWGYYQDDGSKYFNNASTAMGTTYKADGDIVQVAVKAGSIWFGKNNTWNGNPAAGTGAAFSGLTGTVFPMMNLHRYGAGSQPHQVTGRFHAWEQTYSAPSGFNAWDV